jgi:hypothetical protein
MYRTRPALVIFTSVVVVAFIRIFTACGTSPPQQEGPYDAGGFNGGGCAHPNPGCSCTTRGEKAACGTVTLKSDDFIQCSMGTTTCNGSMWGVCDGTVTVDKQSVTGTGVRLQSLTGSPCGTLDPCDPYCEVALGDGGETIASTCTSPTNCLEAAGSFTTLYGNLPGGNEKNPSPCTSGTADNCQYDNACVGTACAPNTPGIYNTACTTKPDFTLGIGCCDATVTGGCNSVNANPNTMTLEVCNRGGVVANTGTLVIGINNGSVGGTGPSGCVDGTTGASWPTGPAIPAGGSNAGWCDVNLATTPIPIGGCISLNIAASCTAMGGGPLDNLSGDHWAVANVPATILTNGQASPLAECDTCNNFTALKDTSATGPLASSFTCTSTACSCSLGGMGMGCTTTVTGTVYDPGVNVPLPNITVYQPSGALIALPDGPSCDTCASLLSPYSSITSTAVDGTFSLTVTPSGGNATIVMQTGKWRRSITIPVTSCTTNALPTCTSAGAAACKTRLPQTSAEGNIPLIALSMGSLEPFECDMAKFMGGSTEMGPASAGKRIQLFTDTGANTSPGATAAKSALWNSQADLNKYSVVILPCSGTGGDIDTTLTAAQEGYFVNYIESGGKMFVDHDSVGQMMEATTSGGGQAIAPFHTAATWYANSGQSAGSNTPSGTHVEVTGNTPTHAEFKTWLTNNGAYGGGYVNTPEPRERAVNAAVPLTTLNAATAQTFEWLRGETTDNWSGDPTGNYSVTFSFDANSTGIVPPGSAGACGRVFYNGMHVDTSRGSASGTFPGECSLAASESPNEAAFEYLIFALTACSTTVAPPPPPPPLPVTTYTSTAIQANCPVGTHVKWGFFEWQATIPPGTSIAFTAQTAMDAGGVPGVFGPAVPVGTASATTTGWTTDPCIVDGHLEDQAVFPNMYGLQPACTGVAPPQSSQQWLQLTFTLNPNGSIGPTLGQWQQLYDCPPTE